MDKPVVKLAVAAVIMAAVVFGLFEMLGPAGRTGVVWAEVAARVQASRGHVFRMRQTQTIEGMNHPLEIYSMNYSSADGIRMESFEAGELTVASHVDNARGEMISLFHKLKRYTRHPIPQGPSSEDIDREDPKAIVAAFLAGDYRELGRRTIEGVPTEGIEVTEIPNAMGNFQVDSEIAQLWVSTETGYPVMLEMKVVGEGGKVTIEMVVDQFEWDVALDPSEFRIEIPADYQPLEILPDGRMGGRMGGPDDDQ